jgi:hypothetical protein
VERSNETARTEPRPQVVEQPDKPAPQLPEQPNEVPLPPSQPDEMPQLPDQPHPPANPPTARAADEREAGEKAASPETDDRSHGEEYPGPSENAPGDPYDADSQRPPRRGADEVSSPTR